MLTEGKLYYYKARVYDPSFGRFLQTDPVGYEDDLSLYSYVGGDPLNKSDPSGLNGAPNSCSRLGSTDCPGQYDTNAKAERTSGAVASSSSTPRNAPGTDPRTGKPVELIKPYKGDNTFISEPVPMVPADGSGVHWKRTGGGAADTFGVGYSEGTYWYTGVDGYTYEGKYRQGEFLVGAGASFTTAQGITYGARGHNALEAFFGTSVGGNVVTSAGPVGGGLEGSVNQNGWGGGAVGGGMSGPPQPWSTGNR